MSICRQSSAGCDTYTREVDLVHLRDIVQDLEEFARVPLK